MSYIAKNPRRTVAALTTALMAVGVAVGSGATFQTSKSSAVNVVSSGTLIQENDKDGIAIYTGTNLKPGDVTTGTVTVKNAGTLAGTFTLSQREAASTFSAGMMNLKIVETRGASSRTVYNGDIQSAGTNVALGRFAAGETRVYTYTATFNQAAVVETDAGKTATAKFDYDSVQADDQSTTPSALLAGV